MIGKGDILRKVNAKIEEALDTSIGMVRTFNEKNTEKN